MRQIASETYERHRQAFGDVPQLDGMLDVGGEYAYRLRGEAHVWRPTVVADLQHAVRSTKVEDAMAGKIPQKWRDYARQINDQSEQLMTLRGLFRIKAAEEMERKPVPIDGEPWRQPSPSIAKAIFSPSSPRSLKKASSSPVGGEETKTSNVAS